MCCSFIHVHFERVVIPQGKRSSEFCIAPEMGAEGAGRVSEPSAARSCLDLRVSNEQATIVLLSTGTLCPRPLEDLWSSL